MSRWIIEQIILELTNKGKSIRNSNVLILGKIKRRTLSRKILTKGPRRITLHPIGDPRLIFKLILVNF